VRKSQIYTSVSLALSAVLLAGSLVMPGYRHSHAGGDLAHHHDRPGHVVHEHGGHVHHHSHSISCEPGHVPHVHRSFLIFDFTSPVPDGDDCDSNGNDASEIVYVTQPKVDAVQSARESFPARCSVMPTPLFPIVVVQATQIRGDSDPPVAATFLCDSARHERSGVQLI
jgi:hypothetical protein